MKILMGHVSKMSCVCKVVYLLMYLQIVLSVKVKVVMHSEDESKIEDEDTQGGGDGWEYKASTDSYAPFMKYKKKNDKLVEYEESFTTEPSQTHPTEMVFPLIYKQKNINSMFKYGDIWYTWAIEKRTDGSSAVNYYNCNDEPKRCDDVGWDSVDSVPKCAFQIEALLPNDRACVNAFGVDPTHNNVCEGADQMKVSDIVTQCGPRIRSFWRFNRVGRRPPNLAKPADVNSMFCEDEEECFLTMEYRIHHDRISFSVHEPTRGQTYKSGLKRDTKTVKEKKTRFSETKNSKNDKGKKTHKEKKVLRSKSKVKAHETKGMVKENDSKYTKRHKNVIKNREEASNDFSE